MAEWKFRVIEYMTELNKLGKTEELENIKFDLQIFGFESVGMALESMGVI